MYGDATVLVISFGDVVNGFTLDPQLGEFILTHRDIKIPESGSIYSCNEGNSAKWDPVIQEYVHKCKNPERGKPKKARYVGSMVADVHRTLLYGGIFLYPGEAPSETEKVCCARCDGLKMRGNGLWLASCEWKVATLVRSRSDVILDESSWRSCYNWTRRN